MADDLSHLPVAELVNLNNIGVSRALNNNEERALQGPLESGKVLLRQRLRRFIRACAWRPMLSSYANDGAPVRVSQSMVFHDPKPEQQSLGKRGQVCTELLCQHLFLRCFDGALWSFLSRRMRQWHLLKAMDRQESMKQYGHSPGLLYLKE